jgi:multidrug resistance efflux pump
VSGTQSLKGLVRLAGVRTSGAKARLARAQAEQRNAAEAVRDEERKLQEFHARIAERRSAMMKDLLTGPIGPARVARLPMIDAVLQEQLKTADAELKSARENLARTEKAVAERQFEVALQLQKQRKIEIAYDQMVIRDLQGAEVAEEIQAD